MFTVQPSPLMFDCDAPVAYRYVVVIEALDAAGWHWTQVVTSEDRDHGPDAEKLLRVGARVARENADASAT